jgi:hypothetical protein
MFACFKRNLRADIKVAQLAGYVAEHSAYHHGEASLMSTILGLAQDFVGSNNLNLLVPQGAPGGGAGERGGLLPCRRLRASPPARIAACRPAGRKLHAAV